MLFSKSSVFAAAAIVGLASAQSATTSAAVPEGSVKAHVVQVSNKDGALTFSPEEVTAVAGDLVQFHFYPRNHSLAQSTFDNPCQPLPQTNGTEGFWSGFMPVTTDSDTMPVFTVVVKDTKPMWFYCATGKHCQNGMAGVINPPAGNAERTLANYKAAAQSVALAGVPSSAVGTGGSTNSSTETPTTGSGSGTGTATSGLPDVATSTNANSGSSLVISSVFALVAAGFAAALTF